MRPIRCRFPFGAALVLALIAAPPALALTLGDLVGGAPLLTASLILDHFQAVATGSADPNFNDYAVQVLPDGFRISGPVSATLGQTGTLLLSYDDDSRAWNHWRFPLLERDCGRERLAGVGGREPVRTGEHHAWHACGL